MPYFPARRKWAQPGTPLAISECAQLIVLQGRPFWLLFSFQSLPSAGANRIRFNGCISAIG